MKLFNNIMLFFLFGFAILAQTVEGQSVTTPDDTYFSSRLVVSPYAQSVPNDSYTFIGVSHPSLDTALTQIGVALEVVGMSTSVNNRAGASAIFTVDAGETHRVFIANQGHATINSTNSDFTDTRTHIIPTANSPQFGSVRITSVSVRPQQPVTPAATDQKGRHVLLQNGAKKYDDLSQLSVWGIVYTQSSGTGFAMEFIGDMHDSSTSGVTTSVPSRMSSCGHGSGSAGCKDVAAGTVSTITTPEGHVLKNSQARPGRGIN